MSFYNLLKKELEKKLDKELLEKLLRSYSMIGKVVIIKLKPGLEKYKKEIGEAILKILPVKTVCLLKQIHELTRKPEIEIIAGNGTETVHKEHKCIYKLDVAKVMFSKGNKFEKLRIVKQVKKGEVVVDMFAGIGYFTIPIAKLTQVKKVYAIDINPEAVHYLRENIRLNKVEDKVEIFQGDCREICVNLAGQGIKANRVLMGYIFNTHEFFPAALEIAEESAIIHYHFLARKEEIEKHGKILEKIAEEKNMKLGIKEIRKIKSYAPHLYHMVMDINIEKKK